MPENLVQAKLVKDVREKKEREKQEREKEGEGKRVSARTNRQKSAV